MPFWMFGVIGVVGFIAVKLLQKLPGAQTGGTVTLSTALNNQSINLPTLKGPGKYLFINMPSPMNSTILWGLVVDGKTLVQSAGWTEDAFQYMIGSNYKVPLANSKGTVQVVLGWPNGAASLIAKILGPASTLVMTSAQQLNAEGLLHTTTWTIAYGS